MLFHFQVLIFIAAELMMVLVFQIKYKITTRKKMGKDSYDGT